MARPPERVGERDSLGHLRHRQLRADRHADGRPDEETGDDEVVANDLARLDQGRHDRDEHAELAEEDARRPFSGDESPRRQRDEGMDRRDEVREVDDLLAHQSVPALFFAGRGPFLNIFSMRSVIMKPPTTLIVAAATATQPRMFAVSP